MMSETVHYTGRLIQVFKGENVEDGCKNILNEIGVNDLGWCDTWAEKLCDHFYQCYYVTEDTIYRVEKTEIEDYADIFQASRSNDGTISFTTKYYNGGCSFDEALQYAFKNMEA